jgi:hypothetical protein
LRWLTAYGMTISDAVERQFRAGGGPDQRH